MSSLVAYFAWPDTPTVTNEPIEPVDPYYYEAIVPPPGGNESFP
jgi:hypothetical protein